MRELRGKGDDAVMLLGIGEGEARKADLEKNALSVSSSCISVRLPCVRIMDAPTYRLSVAAVKPPRSRPAIGCPPM